MTTALLTKREAAARIGVNPATLIRMATDGRFPTPVRLGDHPLSAYRFVDSEVEEWIAERVAKRDAPKKRGRGRPKGSKNKSVATAMPEWDRSPPKHRQKTNELVRAAIMALDPENDDLWINGGPYDGLPYLSVVEKASGVRLTCYEEIRNAAPNWNRDRAIDAALSDENGEG